MENDLTGLEIAVVGLAARFPGAQNTTQFWENLKNGVETIKFFSDEELLEAGIAADTINTPNYIKAKGSLQDVECFDAMFFGMAPGDAEVLDPQTRFFMECSWEALENAGYNPDAYDGLIGLFAGAAENFYWKARTLFESSENVDPFSRSFYNDKNFLSVMTSYKLNLTGPSVTMFTACSTSLVAIHAACQSLLNGECDLALAGGSRIDFPNTSGYFYREGMISSPDGHCRAFDADARGTVTGSGVGLVVLKRLEEAIDDRDYIHAVVKGSAINNDGLRKVGLTAPSIEGQAAVIQAAQHMAQIEPETVSYVETHGTATELGDPTEIEALKLAFDSREKGFCAIGSVKTNFGHLDAAAGVAGFIKTVLALENKLIPPSLHYKKSNPKIDFPNSPFYVNAQLAQWKESRHPRRAGVSSFGIGGTNAHAVLEEAPQMEPADSPRREHQLLLLSAKSKNALQRMTQRLAQHLQNNPHINPADAAYTLQVGRKHFPYRQTAVCTTAAEAIDALSKPETGQLRSSVVKNETNPAVFMFPGQGSQYQNMGRGLYADEDVFREEADKCFQILNPLPGYDLKEILYPGQAGSPSIHIDSTEVTQPLLFIFEYALAKLLLHWGITPRAMIGHSIGEYVAACLSGVFSLEDALALVAARGKLMQAMPAGSMIGVPMPREQLKERLTHHPQLALAAVNSPGNCVVSGPGEAVEAFAQELKKQEINYRPLHTSHAFHSAMMDPMLDQFEAKVNEIKLNEPQLPFISNVTGNWITVEDATDPRYWVRHLRCAVLFADGINELLNTDNKVFIEVGPGKVLSTFVRAHDIEPGKQAAVHLVRHPKEDISDNRYLLDKIGQLWLNNVTIDWQAFYHREQRSRVPLPTYSFDPTIFPAEGDISRLGAKLFAGNMPGKKIAGMEDWFYAPVWQQSHPRRLADEPADAPLNWLVFADDQGIGDGIAKQLRDNRQNVVIVTAGEEYTRQDPDRFNLNPARSRDYETLFEELVRSGREPQNIVHLWNICETDCIDSDAVDEYTAVEERLDSGLHSLLDIVRAIGKHRITSDIRMKIVTNNMQSVTGDDALNPLQATVLGTVKVIPLEYANINCQNIDIALPHSGSPKINRLPKLILDEFQYDSSQIEVAYRGNQRWIRKMKRQDLPTAPNRDLLKEGGCYLITGGMGGMGLTIAGDLAQRLKARLVLIGRSAFPQRDQWAEWLEIHDDTDPVSLKIKKLMEYESMGAQIFVASADIHDEPKIREIVAQAEERFGTINGILHTAGVADYEGAIQKRSRQSVNNIMAPKVHGTIVLHRIFKDKNPDFFALFSCIAALLYKGKFGEVGYQTANDFLDAYAYYQNAQGGPFTVAVNWSAWLDVGMTVEAVNRWYGEKTKEMDLKTLFPRALEPQSGIDIFNRIMQHRFSRIAIYNQDLERTIELMDEEDIVKIREEQLSEKPTESLLERPDYLSTTYVQPQSDTQKRIADTWKAFYGLQQVGIHDDFFELGGDSLKAVTIISLMEKAGFSLSLNDIVSTPTISQLAAIVDGKNVSTEEKHVPQIADTPEETQSDALDCIVKLNDGQNGKSIFIFHPMHGMVNPYKKLALLLQEKYNIYGIQARGVVPGTPMAPNPYDMIRVYLEQILRIQQEGPFILAGYCIGTFVSYEITRRLEAMGHQVETLILFDTAAFDVGLIKNIQRLADASQTERAKLLRMLDDNYKKEMLKEQETCDKEGTLTEQLHREQFRRKMYIIGRHTMPIGLIKAPIFMPLGDQSDYARTDAGDFEKMTEGTARVVSTPGDHDSIFQTPDVEHLAQVISDMDKNQTKEKS